MLFLNKTCHKDAPGLINAGALLPYGEKIFNITIGDRIKNNIKGMIRQRQRLLHITLQDCDGIPLSVLLQPVRLSSCFSEISTIVTSAPCAAKTGPCWPPPLARQGFSGHEAEGNQSTGTFFAEVKRNLKRAFLSLKIIFMLIGRVKHVRPSSFPGLAIASQALALKST